jgi:flavin reductase (DIM6/NTAB) family NADH-FMN oxidoreductase RutF
MKIDWKAGTLIYPLPAVMVTVGAEPSEYNVLTVSWTGTICSDPAMCYISVRPGRHSYSILKKNMEFVINLTTEELARATDWVGVRSGKDYNKFEKMNLTPAKAHVVSAPYIEESPLSIECRVKQILPLGTHDMFIAEVVNILADDKFIDPETGAFDMERAKLLVYSHGKYYGTGKFIGKFGWSVKKKAPIPHPTPTGK